MILKNNRVLKVMMISSLFISRSSNAATFEIEESAISAPSALGKVKIFYDENNFFVEQNNKISQVENCWLDPVLQDVSNEQLEEYLTSGRIFVSQMDNGEFSIRTKLFLKGGGIICGAIGYWGTKLLGYTLAIGVPTAAVVATGGVAGAAAGALGAGGGVAGAGAATSMGVATGLATGAAVTTGASTTVVATTAAVGVTASTVVAGSAGASAATMAVTSTAAVSSAGFLAGIVAGIEGAAATVGGFLLSCPLIP